MKSIILLVFIILSQNLFAQKIFEIDSITRAIKGNIPFDEDFIIKIKDSETSIDSAEVYQLFVVKGKLQDHKKIFFCVEKTGKRLDTIKAETKGKNAYIPVSGLKPNLHFEIVLYHKFRGAQLVSMLNVINDYVDSNKGYKSLKKLSQKIEPPIEQGRRTAIGRYWLARAYSTYPDKTDKADSLVRNMQKTYFDGLLLVLDSAKNSSLVKYASRRSLTSNNLHKAEKVYLNVDKKFSLYSDLLLIIENPSMDSLFYQGAISISSYNKKSKSHQLVERSANLQKSIDATDKLISATKKVSLLDYDSESIYKNVIQNFDSVKAALQLNKKFLDEKLKRISQMLDDEKNMRYTTWYSGSNEIRDLKTAGSYIIIPTIGLTYINTYENVNNYLKPYVGVSIHLRQVNKNIPMRELKRSLLHRLAIELGLTVSEIKDSTGEYFDSLNKMSVMCGVNYKITHAFGISFGGVLLKRADPNPLISIRQTVVNPYVALTIDVDFANAFKGITGKIGF